MSNSRQHPQSTCKIILKALEDLEERVGQQMQQVDAQLGAIHQAPTDFVDANKRTKETLLAETRRIAIRQEPCFPRPATRA